MSIAEYNDSAGPGNWQMCLQSYAKLKNEDDYSRMVTKGSTIELRNAPYHVEHERKVGDS